MTTQQTNRKRRETLNAYLFVLPWILSLLVFTAYPVLASFYFSMTRYTVLNPPSFIGAENFNVMFNSDPLYWRAVWNTAYFSFFSVPLGLMVALGLALLLNTRSKGIGIYRTIYYLPGLMPTVATALIWYILLDPRWGLVNSVLGTFGIAPLGWLRSSNWSMPALILISIWSSVGVPMLIFLAGLKEVPTSLLEAATIDGANAVQRLFRVVLPLITPTIFFNLIIGIINSFQVFTLAFVAAAAGTDGGVGSTVGPLNSLLVYVIHIYRYGFRYYEMGYASAMALVMFLVLVLVTLVLVRTSGNWVYYEGNVRR
ncbi:MAG: sugar ABC transporter permease [Litorilinea sp.]